MNDYMYFATILDPRMKTEFLRHAFETLIKYKMPENKPLSELDITAKAMSLTRILKQDLRTFLMVTIPTLMYHMKQVVVKMPNILMMMTTLWVTNLFNRRTHRIQRKRN